MSDRRPTWADILHPRRKPGGYMAPHLIVGAVIVLIIGVLAGVFVGRHYGASYFQQRYHRSLQVFRVPPPRTTPNLPRVAAVAPAATINVSRYPGVGDQGPVGSCAAWVAAWLASFEYRIQHPRSSLRFSPKWGYEHFGQGADGGSYVAGDLAPFPTEGTPRFKQYPFPPWQLTWPEPQLDAYGNNLAADALKYRQPVQVLYGGTGAAAVEFIREQIYSGHPVGIAIPVYQSFMSSTGTVDLPDLARESVLGGHEIGGIAYDDNFQFPSGNVGGVEIQNQWSTRWASGGRAWISYAFLAQYIYEATSVRLGSGVGAPSAPVSAQYTPHQTFPPPPLPKNRPPKNGRGGGWWMRSGPYHTLINAAASKQGIWPLGLAALVGTESNFIPDAQRCPNIYDCSSGLVQAAVLTAREYGVPGTVDDILAWEKIPSNAVPLGARLVRSFRDKTTCAWRFSRLYLCYNEGPYRGHYAYLQPTPGYGEQAWANYQAWLRYAWATYR